MRRGILQTDYRMTEVMNKWGCNFRTCLAIAEDVAGQYLTVGNIRGLEQVAIREGWVKENLYVLNPGAIIERALREFGIKADAFDFGMIEYDTESGAAESEIWAWAESAGLKETDANYSIMKWERGSSNHFTLFVGDEEIFDSWPVPVVREPVRELLIKVVRK